MPVCVEACFYDVVSARLVLVLENSTNDICSLRKSCMKNCLNIRRYEIETGEQTV